MNDTEASAEGLENGLSAIREAWSQEGLFYRFTKRKQRVREIMDAFKETASLTPMQLVRLLRTSAKHPREKDLCRFALKYYGLDQLTSTSRQCLSGDARPFSVWCALRKSNERCSLQDVEPTGQIISLLLESVSLLVAGEESRTEAYMKGEGEVACWRLAAKRARALTERAASLAQQTAQDEHPPLREIGGRIRKRAEAVMTISSAEAHNDARYHHVSIDPPDSPLPVYMPHDYELALSDEKASAEKLLAALVSIGLAEILRREFGI